MVDRSRGHFIVASQSREHRQPGGVHRGPGPRSLLTDGYIPDGSTARAPVAALEVRVAQLVKPTAVLFEHQDMAVAVPRLRIALDQRIRWNRHRPRIAFIGVNAQTDIDLRLGPRNHLVRYPDGLIVEGPRA